MALLCVSSVLHMLANSNGNIFFWGKFPRFFVEVFHPVAQQWPVKTYLHREPMAELQCKKSVFTGWTQVQATKEEFRNHHLQK